MFDDGYDREKSLWTKSKRGVDFEEARLIWSDPEAIEGPANKVDGEDRWLKVGRLGDRIWAVGLTYRPVGIRIFMVRPARNEEKDVYYGR